MINIFSWLAGTKAGRIMMAIGVALAAFFYALAKAFSAGKAVQKSEQDEATLAAYRSREKVDEEIAQMSDPAVRSELSRWVRR